MLRTFLCLLLAGLVLAGCERQSADPLEWKLEGDRPDELQAWLDTNTARMTPKLAGELAASVNNIGAKTHDPDPARKANLLCRKLDGHTVREVLIAGHRISREALLARLQRESGNLVQLVNLTSIEKPGDEARLQARVTATRQYISQLEQQLTKINSRLEELAWPHAGLVSVEARSCRFRENRQ